MVSNSSLEYLKIIYILYKQNNLVRVTDIAEKMNCSKPNVTKHLNILKDSNLIEYQIYGKINLTQLGIETAKKLLEEEDIIYLLLRDVIGINNEKLKEDASNIKGVISKETLDSISDYVTIKLGLNKLNCNFNIKNEKCRSCVITRNKEGVK